MKEVRHRSKQTVVPFTQNVQKREQRAEPAVARGQKMGRESDCSQVLAFLWVEENVLEL